MTRWLVRIVGVIVALVLLMAGAGWLLPVGHQATITRVVAAPPTAVFDLLTAVDRYPEWRRDVERIERLEPSEGRVRFREHGEFGPITFRIERADRPTLFQTRIDDPDQPFGGTWTFVLVPDGAGTRLTITEDGEVYNPIFRFLSRFVFSQTATMETYAAGLAARWQG